MAFIHTNFLTGNDTTGDGSTALPYKTVFKALGLAASNDTIKVAGGQWTAVSGATFTFTNGSAIVNTSADVRASLVINDVLTFEDNQFGFDKFHLRINVTSAVSLTLAHYWTGPTMTISTVYKMGTFHYNATATNTGFETWNTTAIQPAGRTGITISGGWNSGYTDNSNGWTAARNTATTNINLFNASSVGIGNWQNNLVLDKFLLATNGNGQCPIFYSTGGSYAVPPSLAIGKIATSGSVGLSFNLFVQTLTYDAAAVAYVGLGVWNPPGDTTKLYLSGTAQNSTASYYVNSTLFAQGRPTECLLDIWFSPSQGNSITATQLPFLFGIYSLSGSDAVFKINAKVRYLSLNNINGYPVINNAGWAQTPIGSNFIENVDFYCNKSQIIFSSVLGTTSLKNIGLTGPSAANSGVNFGTLALSLIDFTAAGTTIESKNPCFSSSAGGTGTYKTNVADPLTSLCKLVQSNLSTTQVNDAEGLKTVDIANNVYYKDPINNVLRVTGTRISAPTGLTGGFTCWKVLGVLNKPASSAPFTITLTAKADSGIWDQLGIQYGPNASQTIYSSIALTGEYATYTLTVDPTAYADWSTWIFPLYIGIRSNMPNIFYEEPAPVAYIQSLTIV